MSSLVVVVSRSAGSKVTGRALAEVEFRLPECCASEVARASGDIRALSFDRKGVYLPEMANG